MSSLIESDVSVRRVVVMHPDEVNPGKKLRIIKFENNPQALKQLKCGLCNRAANQYEAAAADDLYIPILFSV